MAIYYTDQQKTKIREWLLELREILTPDKFAPNRERARELVSLLDQRPTHPTCLIAYEFGRVRHIWRRLESQSA